MEKRKRFAVLAAAVSSAVALTGAPSMAADGDCREIRPATATTAAVNACRQDTWLHNTAAVPLVNAGNGALPTWDTTQPTGTSTARYASIRPITAFAPGRAHDPVARPTFTGTYTGVLDNLAVTLYVTDPVAQGLSSATPHYHRLEIDGEVIWENSASTDPEIEAIRNTVSDTMSTIHYAYTDLHAALEAFEMANDPTTEHTIKLSLSNKYYGDGNFIVHFDSAEAPSGIVFNQEPNSRGRLPQYTEIDTN